MTGQHERTDASSPIGGATIGSVLSDIRALHAERSVLTELGTLLDRELEATRTGARLGERGAASNAADPEAVIRVRAKLAATVRQVERRIEELESARLAASCPPGDRDADHLEPAALGAKETNL